MRCLGGGGDRANGLEARLEKLAALRIVRGEFQERLIWDVYLDNMKGGTFREIFT